MLTSKDIIKLLGCTLSLRKGAQVPAGLADIRRSTQAKMERYRCAPAAAGMILESKVVSRWHAVISVYRPTVQDHKRNTALVRRLYKRWCGISRHAKTEALFVPQVESGMGLMDAHTHWAVGVQREWIRNLYQSLDHFGTSQAEYLKYIHKRWGGCPAVLTPHQRSIPDVSAHLWMVLQQSGDHVGLPMWLPGSCDKGSHILLRGPHSLGKDALPEEQL